MKYQENSLVFAVASLVRALAVVLFLVMAVGPGAVAQTSNDEVHVATAAEGRAGLQPGTVLQPAATGAITAAGLLKVQVDLVLVPVTVTDGMNRPVTGLGLDNFAVFEDDKPQVVRYFSSDDAPISVGIILDVSGSMRNKIVATREALAEFFKNSHPEDDYFVITFADHPELLADSTRSVGDIQASLATVEPSGYTSLLDAVEMGMVKLRAARYDRRALLIISDGIDNVSRHKLRGIKAEIEESGVEVYAIGMFDDGLPMIKSLEQKFGMHVLTQVTEASGGRTLTVDNLAKLPDVARTISLEMRNQYVLGYTPSNEQHNGKWRKIKVKVAQREAGNRSRLHAAYKKGYVAPR